MEIKDVEIRVFEGLGEVGRIEIRALERQGVQRHHHYLLSSFKLSSLF